MSQLQALKSGGFISQDIFDRASKHANDELAGSSKETQLAGVAAMGSSEAFSTLSRARNMGTNDPMSQLNKTNDQQLAEHKETNRLLRLAAKPQADIDILTN